MTMLLSNNNDHEVNALSVKELEDQVAMEAGVVTLILERGRHVDVVTAEDLLKAWHRGRPRITTERNTQWEHSIRPPA